MFEQLEDALGCVCLFRYLHHRLEEQRRLPKKEVVVCERCDGRYCTREFVIARTNHRAMWQIRANEFARNGKDQTGLNQRIERAEEIGKRQSRFGVSKRRNRGLHSVAGKIYPFQEVSDFVSANAQQ